MSVNYDTITKQRKSHNGNEVFIMNNNPNNNKLSAMEILFLIFFIVAILLAGKIDTFFLQNGIIH